MPLKGFEEITESIKDIEKEEMVPLIISLFNSGNYTKKTPITNQRIRNYLRWSGYRTTGIRVRIMIRYIRLRGDLVGVIGAGGNGYWYSEDLEEIDAYIDSLDQRIESIELLKSQTEAVRRFIEMTKNWDEF